MHKIKMKSNQQRSAHPKTEESIRAKIERDEKSGNVFLEFPFSSEFPVERYFGNEVLSHEKSAMKTDRMDASAPVLFNHNWDQLIGVVEKVWLENKRAFCRVKMSQTESARDKVQQIEEGVLVNVSFGYEVYKMQLLKENKNLPSDYLVTSWMPFEISFVTIPADYSVGMGRSGDKDAEKEVEVEPLPAEVVDPVIMDDPGALKPEAGKETPAVEEDKNQIVKSLQTITFTKGKKMEVKQAVEAEKQRNKEITQLGEKFNLQGLARELIGSEKSLEECKDAILEKMGQTKKIASETDGDIGLTDKNVKEFSLARAIQAKINPDNKSLQEAAAYEFEVSAAAQKKYGKNNGGITIPNDVLRKSRRDLVVDTASAGGNLVATDTLSMIEVLRSKSVLQKLGVKMLAGLVGNVALPRQTTAASAYWVGEGVAPTEGNAAFDQVSLSPKTIAAYQDFSRKLLLQSHEAIEGIIRGDLMAILALGGDLAGFMGLGSASQPTGLNATTGIGTVDFAGAVPTFAEVVAMESEITNDNADVNVMKYVFNSAMRGSLKSAAKVSSQAIYILDNGQVNGLGYEVSNQLTAGDIWLGVWDQLVMGMWSGIDILVDPYTASKEGNVRITAHQDLDFGVRHAESFCKGANTL